MTTLLLHLVTSILFLVTSVIYLRMPDGPVSYKPLGLVFLCLSLLYLSLSFMDLPV